MFAIHIFILLLIACAALNRWAVFLRVQNATAIASEIVEPFHAAPAKGVGLQRTDELSECDWAGRSGLPA